MLIQGILLGISLSFLIGPLLFAIVEAGISQGFRAGVSVAAGIWFSDILYVFAAFYGIEAIEALVALPNFKLWSGLLGGLLLTGFGVGSLLKSESSNQSSRNDISGHSPSSPEKESSRINTPGYINISKSPKSYLWWWIRGFLVNTINPGTVFFWLGIVSAVVIPSGWSKSEMLIFFGGMLTTLVVTDTLKAWGAKKLRQFLTPKHIRQIQLGIGWLMIGFGIFLGVRAFY
jgi:threonine/homoserine/homoserine lactone efflux protein